MSLTDLTRFETICRDHGLKVTHQRVEVFKAVGESSGHPSVEEVYAIVAPRVPTISLDTVYRTLETFGELGIVKRFMSSDGRYRFDNNIDQHQHLVCTRCGKIEDIDWTAIQGLALPKVSGWTGMSLGHVEVHGLCQACRKDG